MVEKASASWPWACLGEKDSTKHAHETEALVRHTNHNDDKHEAIIASSAVAQTACVSLYTSGIEIPNI